MPRPFVSPRLVSPDPSLADVLAGVEQASREVLADENLSARGKLVVFSKRAAAAVKRIEARRPVLAAKRRELEQKLDRIGALALQGTEASPEERQVFLSLVGAARVEPGMRQKLFDRLTDEADRSVETAKLRRFVLSLPDELTNIAHARELIEIRLRPSLPAEAAQLAHAAAAVEREERNLEQALDAVTAAADRDVLEAEGAVGPRISTWTPEQRADYVREYGMDALGAAIAREALLGADASRAREPGEEDLRVASKDMSSFFSSVTDPAGAAADALLNPAT